MIKPFAATFFLLLLSLLPAFPEESSSPPIILGDTTIALPPSIAGFERLDGKYRQINTAMSRLLPPDAKQRIIATYGSANDLLAVLEGKIPRATHLLLIESMPNEENKQFSLADFQKIKERFHFYGDKCDIKLEEVLGKADSSTSETFFSFLPDVFSKYGYSVPLGIFGETENSILISCLSNSHLTTKEGNPVTGVMAASTITVFINTKVLLLAAGTVYRSPADLEWTRQTALAMRDAILAINPATP